MSKERPRKAEGGKYRLSVSQGASGRPRNAEGGTGRQKEERGCRGRHMMDGVGGGPHRKEKEGRGRQGEAEGGRVTAGRSAIPFANMRRSICCVSLPPVAD